MAKVNTDRFGNPYSLITAYEVVDRKTGEVIRECYKGYVEINGKPYKIEISPRQKETKKGDNAVWVKVTRSQSRPKHTSL